MQLRVVHQRQLHTRLSFIQPGVGNHDTAKQASKIDWIPAKIYSTTGPLTYTVTISEGIEWRRHADHIWDYYPATVSEDTNRAEFVDLMPLMSSPISKLRKKKGVVRALITRLATRLKELEDAAPKRHALSCPTTVRKAEISRRGVQGTTL